MSSEGNKKIVKIPESSEESPTKDERETNRENRILKSQLESKNKEISALQNKVKEQEAELKNIKEENSQLKIQLSAKESNHKTNEIKIIDEKAIQDLETIEEISYNNNGKVVKVYKKEIYVLKIMNVKNATADSLRYFLNEYEIMNLLDHPNIIKTFGICLHTEKMPPSILIEFCVNNLDEVIKNKTFDNVQIAFTIYQIVEGMKYVHFKKIIHRDLKPTNILIATDGTIRISDFGISKLMSPEEQNSIVGTQKFMAPEILNEEDYDEKVDVYSFGVLAFFVLSGGQMPAIKMKDQMKGKKAEIPSTFTTFAKDLIDSCWNFDPDDRPSFSEICEQLNEKCHMLLNLSKPEIEELKNLMKNHKSRIPIYGYHSKK